MTDLTDTRAHWRQLAQVLAYDKGAPPAIMQAIGRYLSAVIDDIATHRCEITEETFKSLQEIEAYLTSKKILP
jgi:hypothetical protein